MGALCVGIGSFHSFFVLFFPLRLSPLFLWERVRGWEVGEKNGRMYVCMYVVPEGW